MNITTYQQLPMGGFAGLKEKQFVKSSKVFPPKRRGQAKDGLANFVYLADANFFPHGETRMHGHKEIDVISVMVAGNISHQGSMEHGKGLSAGQVQVQRAGGEGFSHNEINPDKHENQMIQLWVLPDQAGEPAGYKVYTPQQGKLVKIYGGDKSQSQTFDSKTALSVANLSATQSVDYQGESLVYLSKGSGTLNGTEINARTLITDIASLTFTANEDSQLIVIHHD